MAVQSQPIGSPIEQPSAQRGLQQSQPGNRVALRIQWSPSFRSHPCRLDLPHTFQHHFIVETVRAAMQRKAHPQCRRRAARQEETVATEIVEPDSGKTQSTQQRLKRAGIQDLLRQQVMALHIALVIGTPTHVHRPERQRRTIHSVT